MSIDAVDVVVADRVESVIDGVVFPPADGEFVRVDTGTEWLRGGLSSIRRRSRYRRRIGRLLL